MSQGLVNVDIKFNRPSKIYTEKDNVGGTIIIHSKTEYKHEGVVLDMIGCVQMQLSGKALGVLDAFSGGSAKPIELTRWSADVMKAGKLQPGKTEIQFEIPLEPKLHKTLFETYHGVYIAVQYCVKAEIRRASMIGKNVSKQLEFIVEYSEEKEEEKAMVKPISFTITPESVQNKEKNYAVPKFNITGKLDSCSCSLQRPLSGEVTLHKTSEPIKSIEIQLVRVETCGGENGFSRDATEIQTLQIGDGDVNKEVPIPIYMVFPRLFACPTLETPNFKIEFELNFIVLFINDHQITENFPLTLHRHAEVQYY